MLGSPDLDVVLAVLNLFYVFSKRSNFITRLLPKKRSNLNSYLEYLGEVGVFISVKCVGLILSFFLSLSLSLPLRLGVVNRTVLVLPSVVRM